MTNIAAAIGVKQLEKLDKFNSIRRENADFFKNRLSSLEEVIIPHYPEKYFHVYHLYTIKALNRDQLANYLDKNEIGYGIHYPMPLYKQPLYKKMNEVQITLSVVEKVCKKVISLPVHPGLSDKDLKKIVKVVINFYNSEA